jgi:predicted kinase
VAAAHAQALAAEAERWITALTTIIDQNDIELRAARELFPATATGTLTEASRTALDRIRPLLHSRGAQGLIRRGHGDLHLGNIVLIDGKPVLFDAIEFDPLIAAGDVLYDLAFLLMDLLERGLRESANAVLNRYLAETRRDSDLDALAALPLFMSLRAAIRAKVTAARLEHANADNREGIAKAARAYFRLAGALVAPPAPVLIAVGGLSGTGKSVLARTLAADVPPPPGAVVLRSDVERKMLFNVGETERLPREAYSVEATAKVYNSLSAKAERVIAAGHSVIVDAVFARESERTAIERAAAPHSVRFRGLFLTADLATRIARVRTRTGDASDADAAIAQQQEGYELGALTWAEVDASGVPDATLQHARAALAP